MDARREAWFHSFLDENHLNYRTSPTMVASPAQMRFMVYLEPGQHYYPCTERMFEEIMARVKSPFIGEKYNDCWSRIAYLIKKEIDDPARADFIRDLLYIKFQHETGNYNVIPSRVEKRLYKLFMVTTQIEDPFIDDKYARNQKAAHILESDDFIKAVNSLPDIQDAQAGYSELNLETFRRRIDAAKLRRLFQASVQNQYWEMHRPVPSAAEWQHIFNQPLAGGGWEALENFLLTPAKGLAGHWVKRRILYLANQAGEIVFDLAAIHVLVSLGHTVILAVKAASFYHLVYLGDVVNDPILKTMTRQAETVTARNLTKNQLATSFRNDKPFKIITDGTMEKLNLALTTVTFARVFKEVDGIISKGEEQRQRFFDTKFEFTQDIFNLSAGPGQTLNVNYKRVCPKVVRFSTADLENKAGEIISQMREAKDRGMNVMFYSGIVGSVPGEVDTAIQLMNTFVEDIKKQQAETFIINPSSYFVPGMDADDLMYMWEIVQRSGLIAVWRFQTYQDIERSFALLNRKVPPQWVGKDATFSTGCTKEMAIALDVQKQNPEMQIIGPDPEKFIRRSEYGIGLFHDTKLSEIYVT